MSVFKVKPTNVELHFILGPSGVAIKNKQYPQDAGYDLPLPHIAGSKHIIKARGYSRICLDIGVQLVVKTKPYKALGHYLRVTPRSSAAKAGILLSGEVVDDGYVGWIHLVLFNFNDHDVEYAPGDRVAQLIPEAIFKPEMLIQVDELIPRSERGENAFGSTGLSVDSLAAEKNLLSLNKSKRMSIKEKK